MVAIYEAPQELTDKQLAADPIKYGKMANPAWGHTAHEEEYLADYNASKRTLSGLADFKMYRLNVWQHTSSQWLRLNQWLDCGDSSLTLDDYHGRPTACGLDLSKTRDMSALSISIPIGKHQQQSNRIGRRLELSQSHQFLSDRRRGIWDLATLRPNQFPLAIGHSQDVLTAGRKLVVLYER